KNKFETNALDWSAVVREHASHIHLPRSSRLHIPVNLSFKAMLKSAFNVRGTGVEKPPDGPCIFAPNHQSVLDAFLVSIFLDRPQVKRTFFYAKARHIRGRLMRWIAGRFNVVVVDLEADVKGSIQALAEVLKQGKSVIIFPEGTRSANGEVGPFKKTFAILSKELNVPVVPIAIDGAHRALPRGSRRPRFRQNISVQFLPPVYPNGMDYDQINETVRNAIIRQMDDGAP
ncbi:MAG TPA: lysophospholipid acyltransferase family protein, partial [Tichowtungia sp.]|nr:lysophospholipid acyltransferase family protein [Tichowtungia sp.]